MAVNKNFVVKNGLEVNDNLLVADQTTQKVGIGTSVASYTLHVQGGIGATEARVTGVSTFVGSVHAEENFSSVGITTLASAGGITTTGGDLYIGGDLYVLDDVVYDEVNGRNIYISGVSTFTGISTFGANVFIDKNLSVGGITTLANSGGITTTGGDLYVGGDLFVLDDIVYDEVTGRNLNISGIATFVTVDVNGNLDVSGIGTIGIASITDAVVSGASTFMGIGTFVSDLYVGGNAYVTGDLTFDEFTARNASITGITTTTSLHVGTGGTVINASTTGTVQIGSATTLATVTINGGSVPSVGLVIALGG